MNMDMKVEAPNSLRIFYSTIYYLHYSINSITPILLSQQISLSLLYQTFIILIYTPSMQILKKLTPSETTRSKLLIYYYYHWLIIFNMSKT